MKDLTDDEIQELSDDEIQEIEPSNPLVQIGSNIAQSATSTAKDIGTGVSDIARSEFSKGLLEDALDFAKAGGQGATMQSADELGAIPMTAIEALYNKFDPTNRELEAKGFKIEKPGLADLYRQNQQLIQKDFDASSERSPIANLIGQLGGGVATGGAVMGALGLGGKAAVGAPKLMDLVRNKDKLATLGKLGLRGATSYGKMAPLIATEAALGSKEGGLLSEEERSNLLRDTTGGLLFGVLPAAGLTAAQELGGSLAKASSQGLKNKISNWVEETPLARQAKISYGYGAEQGINPKAQTQKLRTELGHTGVSELDNQRAVDLLTEIQNAQKEVGAGIKKSMVNAENAGVKVNLDDKILQSLNQMEKLGESHPNLIDNTRAKAIFGKIANTGGEINPSEARDLIKDIDAYIARFKSSQNKTTTELGILENLYETRSQFSDSLKSQIPEYKLAAERFEQFSNLVPETILSKGDATVQKKLYYGDIKNGDVKLSEALQELLTKTTKEGSASSPVQSAFVDTIKGLKQFEQQEGLRQLKGQISEPAFKRSASAIEEQIKRHSDDAVARQAMDTLNPHGLSAPNVAKAATGMGETARSMVLSSANLAGRMSYKAGKGAGGAIKNEVADLSRKLFNAPDEISQKVAQSLKSHPGLEKYGNQLEDSLQSPDKSIKNRVMFTIMQNPASRAFVKPVLDEEDQNTEQIENTSYTPQE